MRKFSRRTTTISVGMALVVATSVIAYAFWTGVGAGVGTADTGDTATPLEVIQTSTPTDLVPGGAAGELSGHFNNPNTAGVHVNQVVATIDSIVPAQADTSKPPCTAADFLVGAPATVNATINPGNPSGSWGPISIQLVNDVDDNQDNCRNVTVNMSYTTT